MKKVVAAVAVFTAIYMFFLLISAPASILTYAAQLPKGITLHQLSGSVWQPKIDRLDVSDISLHEVTAQLSPLSLLLLSPSADVTFGGGLHDGPQGQAVVSMKGQMIEVADAHIELSANTIVSLMQSPVPVEAFGLARAQIDTLVYEAGLCHSATGEVQWLNAAVAAMGEQIELGKFDAELSCIDRLLTVNVKPTNRLGLSFTGELLKNGRISGDGYIKPGNKFPHQLRDLLSFIGKPDNQGRYRIHL